MKSFSKRYSDELHKNRFQDCMVKLSDYYMNEKSWLNLFLFILLVFTGCNRNKPIPGNTTDRVLKTGCNPVITEGSADPSVRVFNNRVFIYSSHDFSRDNDFWIMKDWKVYSSADLVNFTDHGIVLKGKEVPWAIDPDHCWAPDCAEKNGKYYFYFPLSDKEGIWKGKIGVGIGDKPYGPFKEAIGKPLIDDTDKPKDFTRGYYNIDPAVFTDENEKSYLFWGNGACFMAELNEDMISLNSEICSVIIENNRGYMEGPFIWKRKGIYYLLYSRCGSSGYDVLDYATSDDIKGPYKYRGTIVGHSKKGNEHGSVFQYKNQWYVAYHDLFPTDKYRQTCLDRIHYRENGYIIRVNPTRSGVGWYDASEKIEAEDYFEKSGNTEYRELDSMNFYMGGIKNGDWIKFSNVKLPLGSISNFSARVATGSKGGEIKIIKDNPEGEIIGELKVRNTGGWDSWQNLDTSIVTVKGTMDILLKFTGDEGELFNFDWFRFY
jgi:arabinoxylan arabinofuranohydrolase